MNLAHLVIFVPLISVSAALAQTPNSYAQSNLVSDIPGMALTTDARLVNPWGLSRPASQAAKEAHWWANDQVTGLSTLYDANGAIVPLTVTVPPASGTGTGSPTGTNVVGANFVFATLDGTISEWISATQPAPGFDHRFAAQTCTSCHVTAAVIKVNNAASHAVYTGSTTSTVGGAQVVFVANANGGVEEYSASFSRVTLAAGAFTDPKIPAGYTPYGIQAIGSKIYVTYSGTGANPGGYVDAYSLKGALELRLQNGTWFDGPWGIALAPSDFGAFSSDLLVGNTTSGLIAAFSPTTGKFLGYLDDSSGQPIANPGLWALYFGAGNADSGPVNTLYFNAGIQNFTHGLFGAITSN